MEEEDKDGQEHKSVLMHATARAQPLSLSPSLSNPLLPSPSPSSSTDRYDAVGFDVFRSQARVTPVSPLYSLPDLADHAKDFSHDAIPATFVLNLQVLSEGRGVVGRREREREREREVERERGREREVERERDAHTHTHMQMN